MARKQIGLKLDDSLIAEVDEAAEAQKLSRTAFIEAALAERLNPAAAKAPPELKVNSRPEAMTLEDGTRVFPPPEGTDPDQFWAEVRKLSQTGMPMFNASKEVRAKALGVETGEDRAAKAHVKINEQREYVATRVPQLIKAGKAKDETEATIKARLEFRIPSKRPS